MFVRKIIFSFWVLITLSGVLNAGDFKLTRLQFSVGQPADAPSAKITIAEISQGAQKRGFLRLTVLPLMVANKVEVRFLRADLEALNEVREVLTEMVKMEAQEWRTLSLFVGGETVPRLTAEEAVPKRDFWMLKGVWVRKDGVTRALGDCAMKVKGAAAGSIIGAAESEIFHLDLGPSGG